MGKRTKPWVRSLAGIAVLLLVVACAPLRQEPETPVLEPAPAAEEGPLATWLDPLSMVQEGESGFRLLAAGHEAFRWRVDATRLAEDRLAIQYYIWRDDLAGRALIAELLDAADRGVHVYLLLDDMDVRGDDRGLAILDAHEHVEVRLFNPFRTRWGVLRAGAEFVFRGADLNHRMHNKAWIADGRFAILGGRNIANEYFDVGEVYNFADLDVAVVGPLAEEAEHAFVEYWNSPAAVPVGQVRRIEKEYDEVRERRGELNEWLEEHRELIELLRGQGATPAASARGLTDAGAYAWTADAELVVDDPAKGLGGEELAPGVLEALLARYDDVEEELILISPYFTPAAEGTRLLTRLADDGVNVEVLTNSLAATDVALAHSGYARRRIDLLEGGVTLREIRPSAWSRGYQEDGGLGLGSSRASLHSKAQILDGEEVFIGSFNLGPRSAHINTEMGLFLEEEAVVEELRSIYELAVDPMFAYQVGLDEDGQVIWTDDEGQVHHREPKAGFWRRFVAGFARLLPVESQL